MRKGTVLSLNKFGIFNSVRKSKTIIFLTVIFIIGIILGIILISKSNTTAMLSKFLFERYLYFHIDKSFLHIFLNSLFLFTGVIFIVFVCGTSFIGIILTPAYTLLLGYLYGGFLGYIYSEYILKGIAFNSVIIVPVAIFLLLSVIFSSKISFNFSFELLKLTFNEQYPSVQIYNFFKSSCNKYLIYLILVLIASLLDALLSIFLLHFFKF